MCYYFSFIVKKIISHLHFTIFQGTTLLRIVRTLRSENKLQGTLPLNLLCQILLCISTHGSSSAIFMKIRRKETRRSGDTLTINTVFLNSPDSPPGCRYCCVTGQSESLCQYNDSFKPTTQDARTSTCHEQGEKELKHNNAQSWGWTTHMDTSTETYSLTIYTHTGTHTHKSYFDRVTPVECVYMSTELPRLVILVYS